MGEPSKTIVTRLPIVLLLTPYMINMNMIFGELPKKGIVIKEHSYTIKYNSLVGNVYQVQYVHGYYMDFAGIQRNLFVARFFHYHVC